MQRVAVVGSGGAGKTTFSRELSHRTGLPIVHLDRHYWKPGWVESPRDEWRIALIEKLEGEQWIADGNYAGTFDVRFSRADTIIVLAPPRWRCISRAIRRSFVNHGLSVQAEGCPERIDVTFLWWLWRYPKDGRPLLDEALRVHGQAATVYELNSSRDVTRFLEEHRS